MGSQDHRLQPGPAGAVRIFDDKTLFLTHNVQIGRNFDEYERKPLDGGSAPRRAVSDENIHGGVPVRHEPKPDYPLAGNIPSRPATIPISQFPGGSTGGSYAARFSETANVSSGTGRSYVKSEVGSLGPSPNAWGPRKVAGGISESVAASWSAPDAATKLAHASALEKVSSGRWLSNQHKQIDIEVIRHPEPEAKIQSKGSTHATFSYGSADVPGGRRLSINDRMPMLRTSTHSDVVQVQVQPPHGGGALGGPELTERPKLKLLPRSKPVDNTEPLVAYKQTIPQSEEPVIRKDTYGNVSSLEHDLTGPEDGHQASERPRVNLNSRFHSLEQTERNTERERVNKDITRAENPPMHQTVTSRQNRNSEPFHHHRTGKTVDRRDPEKSDAQRRSNWRNDNRKNNRDREPQQERPPSPETWRKPVDPAQ